MANTLSVVLGIPKHGWLPVCIHFDNFNLDFIASHILNNPVEELYTAITSIESNRHKCVTWLLEPAAYFFDFEKKGKDMILTIAEIDHLHEEQSPKKELIRIMGDNKTIIEPFFAALKEFSSYNYDKADWRYECTSYPG